MYPPLVIWTEERVEELTRLWVVGLAGGAIAKRMNTTRNAIIGKAHRLGLISRKPQRDPEEQQRIKQEREQLRNASRVVRQRTERQSKGRTKMHEAPNISLPFIGSLEIPFNELDTFKAGDANQCLFIAAETPGPDYLACGNETLPGASYCGHHHGIVYTRDYGHKTLSPAELDRRRAQGHAMARTKWGTLIKTAGPDSAEASL